MFSRASRCRGLGYVGSIGWYFGPSGGKGRIEHALTIVESPSLYVVTQNDNKNAIMYISTEYSGVQRALESSYAMIHARAVGSIR